MAFESKFHSYRVSRIKDFIMSIEHKLFPEEF